MVKKSRLDDKDFEKKIFEFSQQLAEGLHKFKTVGQRIDGIADQMNEKIKTLDQKIEYFHPEGSQTDKAFDKKAKAALKDELDKISEKMRELEAQKHKCVLFNPEPYEKN